MQIIPPSVSPVEIEWYFTGFLGAVCCAYSLSQWVMRLRVAYDQGKNGRVRLQLWKNVIIDGMLFLAQYLFMVAGIVAMMTPPANPRAPITPAAAVLGFSIIIAEIVIAAVSLVNLAIWEILIRMTPTARERASDRES
jgi:hypothetical protein